ncbi:MAG: transporter substrate-binding domain-containing protein [Actinobacteria bacterium]|nr:transporter substrate-binding domain-containing protein [Actinomycetota bacterium]
MKRLLIALILVVLAAGVVALAGCGQKQVTLEKGIFLMGSEEVKPWCFKQDGEYTGLNYDICNEIAKRMGGLELVVVETKVPDLIKDLDADKYDMIGNPYTITPERSNQIGFTIPYMQADNWLVIVTEGSPITKVEETKGTVVGVPGVSLNAKGAEMETAEVRNYPDFDAVYNALDAGEVDAAVVYAHDYNSRSSDDGVYRVIEEGEVDKELVFGVKKGNQELLDEINQALEEMLEDGTIEKLEKKWTS